MTTTFANTSAPPYYAVIFTSVKRDDHGYDETSRRMYELASKRPGFLGVESARGDDGLGITVSYWISLEAIAGWKQDIEHLEAQRLGRDKWYSGYVTRIAKIERAYDFIAK